MTKIMSCAVALGLVVASSSGVLARGTGGASSFAPGHEMKSGGTAPVSGLHGAAGWAPGQQMRAAGGPTVGSHGAAVYTPGFLK